MKKKKDFEKNKKQSERMNNWGKKLNKVLFDLQEIK